MDAAGCVWWLEMWTRCQRRGLSVLFSRFRSIMQTRQHSSYHLLESCDVFLACPPRKGVPSFAVLPEGSSSSILLGGSFTSPDRGSKVRRNQSQAYCGRQLQRLLPHFFYFFFLFSLFPLTFSDRWCKLCSIPVHHLLERWSSAAHGWYLVKRGWDSLSSNQNQIKLYLYSTFSNKQAETKGCTGLKHSRKRKTTEHSWKKSDSKNTKQKEDNIKDQIKETNVQVKNS